MAKKTCPGCGKQVPNSENKCRYCNYPFDIIRDLKNECIEETLEKFKVAYDNLDRDVVLQAYGVLAFLDYKYINMCKAKIYIMDKKYEEAIDILSTEIIKGIEKSDALMLSLEVFALEGKYLELCKIINKYNKELKDSWKVLYYYVMCVENQSYEERCKYVDEFEKGKVQALSIEIWKTSDEDLEVISKIHIQMANALIRGMEEVKRQVFILRVADEDMEFTENNNQIVRNAKHILTCYSSFFRSSFNACKALDGFIEAVTGDTSCVDEYNTSLQLL